MFVAWPRNCWLFVPGSATTLRARSLRSTSVFALHKATSDAVVTRPDSLPCGLVLIVSLVSRSSEFATIVTAIETYSSSYHSVLLHSLCFADLPITVPCVSLGFLEEVWSYLLFPNALEANGYSAFSVSRTVIIFASRTFLNRVSSQWQYPSESTPRAQPWISLPTYLCWK